jgi:Mn-dependent DtxR family transcriptional regulator
MRKWFLAIYTVAGARRPPSARDLATLLDVNRNTASQMLLRLRYATVEERELLGHIIDAVTEANGRKDDP